MWGGGGVGFCSFLPSICLPLSIPLLEGSRVVISRVISALNKVTSRAIPLITLLITTKRTSKLR